MLNDSSSATTTKRRLTRASFFSVFGRILFALAVFVVSQIVAAILVVAIGTATNLVQGDVDTWLNDSVGAQFAYILVAETLVVVAIVLFLRHKKESLSSIGVTPFRSKFLPYAAIGYGAYFGIYILVATLIYTFVPGIDVDQEQQVGFDGATGALELGLTFASLVIIPPLVEEFLFRGFLFSAVRKYFSLVTTTIVVSILFALGHLQFGNGAPLLWIAAIDTFVLSVILCVLREKTGSIWSGVIINALKNGVAFTALFLVTT